MKEVSLRNVGIKACCVNLRGGLVIKPLNHKGERTMCFYAEGADTGYRFRTLYQYAGFDLISDRAPKAG